MLPLSLRELCNSFKIKNSKGYFPVLFNDLNYKGIFPNFEFFNSISKTEYLDLKNQYTNHIWNFKEEAIKYCELDCVALHQVISKFSVLIFNNFKVDPIKSLTLPALAMKIWKSFYMPKDSVYRLHDLPEYNIRKSYTGGAVDVYIPINKDNETLYYYDVNSLYPSVMLNNPMPVGNPIAFDGDIRKVDPQSFGFFYCKITSPEFLEHPLLQCPEGRRIKTSEGLRTIAGLGSWHGWINSLEMDNCLKYGYQFEILKGYQFETGDLFSGYITKLYNLRLEYSKGHPMNLIAKLLMNSLYGKFGMRLEMTKVEIYNVSDQDGLLQFENMLKTYDETIHDYIKIDDNYVIIRDSLIDLKYDSDQDMYHGQDVNIAIASAITAGARVYISIFKNSSIFRLYYSDTDSVVIDKTLPEKVVGGALGQLKLEHTIERAVFLAPKVYGFIDINGNEVVKVKGVTQKIISDLHFNDLQQLLIEDSSREFTQEKWFKSVIEGGYQYF
jgi:DNA polymerase type B, organellar and viral